MVKHIAKIVLGEELYNIKDTEVRGDLNNHASNTDIHVTAAEKEYWNSKVNPPSYSAPTAKQLTYTGEAQDLLNPGSSTSGSIQYSTDETNWSTTIPQATNAGTYTVYWKFAGSEIVYVDSTAINVTMAKANPTYTAPTAKTLTYNGSAQELLNAGTSNDGTIGYSVDNENWGSSIPQETNAGDYMVYWKLTGDANHNDVASTAISVSIAKVTPTVVAPTAKTLTYSGTAQELVNAGSTDFGTLQYSLDDETYSTTIPSGTNAGDYTVYYKVVGDSNVNDVAANSINVSIEKATGSVTTAPTGKTLDATGSAQALVTAGSSDTGTMMYSLDNSNWSSSIPTATDADTYTIYYKAAESANYTESSVGSVTTTIVLPDGVYAVTTAGKEVPLSQVNTSNPSGYVGVSVKYTQGTNMHFFIDKRFPTGSAVATNVGNYKAWSAALYNKDQSYLTNISNGVGDGNSIATAAPRDTRAAALNAYNNGETGVVNTNNICNDSNCASETAQNNAAKYCRSIANPVTGAYDGYLGSLAEWIVVNDNQVEINQVLTAIGGVTFSVTASGYTSSTLYWISSELFPNYAWTWKWDSSLSFAFFNNGTKSNGLQRFCSRPFFPLS